jgi:hypothetical protein
LKAISNPAKRITQRNRLRQLRSRLRANKINSRNAKWPSEAEADFLVKIFLIHRVQSQLVTEEIWSSSVRFAAFSKTP